MLGKLIKNEFVHRAKPVISIFAGLSVLSLFELVLILINDYSVIDNKYFSIIYILMSLIWSMSLFAGVVGLVMLSVDDYGKRFFKDQGYLTHTLPVKTSQFIFARIVCDLSIVLAMAIIYPLIICITMRDFNIYTEVYNSLYRFINSEYSAVDKLTLTLCVISAVIFIFLGILFEMWHFYTAYALGHSFKKGKKAMSVVCYIAIYLVIQFILVFLVSVADNLDWLRNIGTSNTALLIVLCVMNIGMVLGIAIFGAINSFTMKRINLE